MRKKLKKLATTLVYPIKFGTKNRTSFPEIGVDILVLLKDPSV